MNLVFKALADPQRRKILHLLRDGDMTAGQIAEHFDISKPSLSKHFMLLQHADLIEGTRNGTNITYSLKLSVLEEALAGLMEAVAPERRKKWKPRKKS
jgi:ArsR family transcriptional regulator, arsenate/arsenite/antimonite-responsive transcriptional repressor